MLITHFKATKVYGYLKLDINFNKDMTFIVGYNGSGKTTAIKLLNAILTPNLTLLTTIPFSSLSVTLIHEGKQYTIKADKDDGKTINISMPRHDFSEIMIPHLWNHDSEEYDERYIRSVSTNDYKSRLENTEPDKRSVLYFIQNLPSPIFLGLDRTITSSELLDDEMIKSGRRYSSQNDKRLIQKFQNTVDGLSSGLVDVQNLISKRMRYIRKISDREYEKQRNNFLISSFKYTAYKDFFDNAFDTNMDREILSRRKEIEHTLSQMRIFDEDAQTEFHNFFNSIQNLIDSRMSNKDDNSWQIEWLVNKAQIERMHNFLKIIDNTKQKIDSVSSKLNQFLEIVNQYYEESGKTLYIEPLGKALIKLPRSNQKATLNGLSSGERQILIIFANSILRKNKDSVFIIDEPELSLHLQWQEKLVDDIGSLETGAQFIFATHSPEIVAGYEEKCKEVAN